MISSARLSRRLLLGMPLGVSLAGLSRYDRTSARQADAPFPEFPDEEWTRGDSEDNGIDPSLPDAIEAALPNFPTVTGVVVVRNGRVITEHYPADYDADDRINIRSVTKSVVSTLIGIALHRSDLDNLNQTIGELIPDRIPDGADPGVEDITIKSLLTMTTGLWWDASTDYEMLRASDNYVETTLSRPIVAKQGTVYVYNSGSSHLLGVILEAATGQELEDYAEEHLFRPLGIERGEWWESPQDEAIGGFGLNLTPRDMARLGLLYLREGVWEGERLVDQEYIAAATSYQSAGDSTGGTPYGYQWWVTDATGYDAFFALGWGGQYIYVVPALDLITVTTVGFEEDAPRPPLISPRPLIQEIIVPSVRD